MKEGSNTEIQQSLDMQQRICRLQEPVNNIRQEAITFNYDVNLGLLELCPLEPTMVFKDLTALGGQEFASEYLAFLSLLNGFDINGYRMYGVYAEHNIWDVRNVLDSFPFPEIYDGYLQIGMTDLDVLLYNKSNHHFEIRDRIGFDYIVGSYPQLDQFLQVLATSIKKSFEDEDEDDRE